MIRRFIIGLVLFLVASIGYLSVSGAPPRVHVLTVVPWFAIVALASLVAWSPLRSAFTRWVLMAVIVFAGSALLLYASTAFFGKMEPSLRGYIAFLILTVVVLAAFLGITAGLARVTTRWWPTAPKA